MPGSPASEPSPSEPSPSELSPSEPGSGVRTWLPARGRLRRGTIEWAIIVVVALLVALIIKTFFIQAFYIPSGSMEPTLMPGDRVLVNKLSYDLHPVHRGDIVVFARPPSDHNLQIKDLIKRVIGLPGNRIQAIGGKVYINGKPLAEPYLPPGTTTTNLPLTVVPKGEYYMLGDNRGNSADSRVIGPISGKLIVGRAFVLVWPLSRIHWF